VNSKLNEGEINDLLPQKAHESSTRLQIINHLGENRINRGKKECKLWQGKVGGDKKQIETLQKDCTLLQRGRCTERTGNVNETFAGQLVRGKSFGWESRESLTIKTMQHMKLVVDGGGRNLKFFREKLTRNTPNTERPTRKRTRERRTGEGERKGGRGVGGAGGGHALKVEGGSCQLEKNLWGTEGAL